MYTKVGKTQEMHQGRRRELRENSKEMKEGKVDFTCFHQTICSHLANHMGPLQNSPSQTIMGYC